MARRIVELMPAHSCYVEPFAGGLAVLFEKGFPSITSNANYREVINDRDEDISNFWAALRDPNHEFHHQAKYTPYSKATHDQARNEKSAWGTWVSTVQSFGNKKGDSWARDKTTESRASLQNSPLTFMQRVADLPLAAERLRGAYIECDDALAVIQRWDSPYTLHYCDPPYPGTACSPYVGDYTLADLQALVDVLAECQGSVMLSNYPQPGLSIPDDWVRHEFQASTSVSSGHKKGDARTEVLWVCDRSDNADPSQRKYMWSPSNGYTLL